MHSRYVKITYLQQQSSTKEICKVARVKSAVYKKEQAIFK